MLKERLGSLLSVPVELVFCAGETLHFRCKHALSPGQVRHVRARLPEGQMFAAKLEIRSLDASGKLYVGRLIQPLDAIPHLRRLLPLPFEDRRISPRIEHTVRVMSPQIQGYSAMTRDVSVEGLCLVLSHMLPVGTALQLEVDLVDEPLRFEMEIRWVAPDLLSGNHLVGGRFRALTRHQLNALKGFLQRQKTA